MQTELVENRRVGSRATVRICSTVPNWSLWAWSNPTKVLYGPVPTRRLGRSLGINLFPNGKHCSFKCAYCDLEISDRNLGPSSLVSPARLEVLLEESFQNYPASGGAPPDSLTFAGNGEPTLHPGFAALVKRAQSLRDDAMPSVPLNLFTNGMHLSQPHVLDSFYAFRRVFLKVDGCKQTTLERLNGAGAWSGTRQALSLVAGLKNVAASTMVVAGSIDNIKEVASQAFADQINKSLVSEIYLYTLDYPAKHRGIRPLSLPQLQVVGEVVAEQVSASVIVLWRAYRHPSVSGLSENPNVAPI